MERQLEVDLNIPTAFFDGDQSDPRAFSKAQYETRVQGLVEIMAENNRGRN
jgi:benzoyl-CoA reductase/2-hydroxyglutaryl-CoA dehydratase subunit BcrC/BadD/HgdB